MSAAARKSFLDTILKGVTVRNVLAGVGIIASVILSTVSLAMWWERRITTIETTQRLQHDETTKQIADLKTAIENLPKCNCSKPEHEQREVYYGVAGIKSVR